MRQFLLPLLLICFLCTGVRAQTGIEDNNVTVISNFRARLENADRITVRPVPPPPDTSRIRQQYTVIDQPITVDYPAPVIRPRGITRQKAEPSKNGYASIGVGLPGALSADLSYDLTGVDNAELGLYAKHFSFNNDGDVENQRSSDTEVGVEGTYLFDQGFALNGGASYTTQSRYYYGYNFPLMETDSTPSFTQDQARQRFNTIDLHGNIFNGTRTAADIDYKAGVGLYLMDGNPAVRETGLDLRVEGTKWISDDTPLDIKFRADFTTYKDTATQNLNNIYLSPSYTTPIAGRYRLKIGVNLTSQDDDFDVFPNLAVTAPIIDGLLSGFVGAEGSLQKNTLRSLADYNPWIETRLRVRNSEYTRIYGGVDGNFSGVGYRIEAGYKIVDNLALFVLDRSRGLPQFDVVYDDGNIFTLQGSATYDQIDNLKLSGTIAQRFYSLEDEEEAWHLPSFTLNLGAHYQLLEGKASVGADFYLENGLPYQTLDGGADNLNALSDLSLSGEYNFNDNFSGWLRINNLLNNKRQRFVQYPTIGTNLLVGVAAKF